MSNFDDIRPYDDSQIADAMARIVSDPLFDTIRRHLFVDYSADDFAALFLSVTTVEQFQSRIMHSAIHRILKASSSNFRIDGLANIDKHKAYVFVSNHRDIVLDSALLQVALYESRFPTTQITFGSNLMSSQMVIDIGKSNKMFTVERPSEIGNVRQFLQHSRHLSAYIRHTVVNNNESIWIAQRNGRTKDGDDTTEPGLIKMLSLSGSRKESLGDHIAELNIVPTSISYQWEPCDALKTQEIYISRRGKYQKAQGEDVNSILTGIFAPKGDVVINILPSLSTIPFYESVSDNEVIRRIADFIDFQIHSSYHLFNTNYLAWDLLHNSHNYKGLYYDAHIKAFFCERMDGLLDNMVGDREELRAIFLGIYANPVTNLLKTKR